MITRPILAVRRLRNGSTKAHRGRGGRYDQRSGRYNDRDRKGRRRPQRHYSTSNVYLLLLVVVVLVLVVVTGVTRCVRTQNEQKQQELAAQQAEQEHQAQEAAANAPKQVQEQDVNSLTLRAESSSGNVSPDDLKDIKAAIESLNEQNIHPAVSLQTIDGSLSVSYNDNTSYYTASSIKGVYITALLQEQVDTDETPYANVKTLIENAIIYSDNSSYASLRRQYGDDCLKAWMKENDIDPGVYDTTDEYAEVWYPRSTSAQLMDAWLSIYPYVTGDEGCGPALAKILKQREVSPIKDAVQGESDSDEVTTMSKAGWYPLTSEQEVTPAANDAGIVIREGNDRTSYAIAIMSDANQDLDALKPLISALDQFVTSHASN